MKLVTESEFNEIKKLTNEIPVKYITKISNRSSFTIRLVKRYPDYAAYRNYTMNRNKKPISENKSENASPQVSPDISLDTRLTNIENMLNQLLNIFEEKEAKANVAFWKRG